MSSGRIIISNNGVKMIARITYNAADVIINIVHLLGGGGSVYSKFQVTGMIRCNNQKPKNFLAQKLTPKKSHADFRGLKNFHKALNDVTREIKLQKRVCLFFIRRTTRPGCAGTTANTAPPPAKSWNRKFQTHKIPLLSQSLRIGSTPHPRLPLRNISI